MKMKPIADNLKKTKESGAFTLIELLVVISVIAVLAAFTIPALSGAFKSRKISVAQGELQAIETALENYKAKYGTYPPGGTNVVANQLYYELAGTTTNGSAYQTLDGGYHVPYGDVVKIFGAGGFINCTKGGGEDAVQAKNFISELKSTQVAALTNQNTGDQVPYLVTSVEGPDAQYQPLGGGIGNPIRYQYPGTHNPNSYDLWVQLSMGSKLFATPPATNFFLVCNWAQGARHNDFSVP